MTTYNQEYRNESSEKAERNSSVVEFYDRCRKSAGKSVPWHMLPVQHQVQFVQAASIIHSIIYQGE